MAKNANRIMLCVARENSFDEQRVGKLNARQQLQAYLFSMNEEYCPEFFSTWGDVDKLSVASVRIVVLPRKSAAKAFIPYSKNQCVEFRLDNNFVFEFP